MAFSTVTITGQYNLTALGTLTFTLSDAMANGGIIAVPSPIVVTVSSGAFSQGLYSNGDAGTVPQGIAYCVTEQISGSPIRDYSIFIPPEVTETNGETFSGTNANIVQLSSVTANLNMVGQSITGPNIPSDTTIVGVQVGNPENDPLNPAPALPLNSVTISNPATAVATGQTFIIGATIDLSMLMPGAPFWA